MPKTIILPDHIDDRLKRLARPLEDTYASIIERLLDVYERKGSSTKPPQTDLLRAERTWDPFDHPSLTHTKVTLATIDSHSLRSPNWNALLDETLRVARKMSGSVTFVRKYANVNIVDGKKVGEGYHYLSDVGFSVQGQDANDAWRAVAQMAKRLGLAVEVHFFWRHKDGAALPGENGMFKLDAPVDMPRVLDGAAP